MAFNCKCPAGEPVHVVILQSCFKRMAALNDALDAGHHAMFLFDLQLPYPVGPVVQVSNEEAAFPMRLLHT